MDMRTIAVGLLVLGCMGAGAQQLSLSRAEATVLVEPYAPNVVRVSLSLRKDDALAGPGYGVTAKTNGAGWAVQSGVEGDVLRSSRMVVTVTPQGAKYAPTGTAADIAKFFNGSTPGVGISIMTPEGASLVKMQGWQMSVPNHKDMNADILHDRRSGDAPFFQVGATFASPPDEHYYGLGQNQEGYLDRRGHAVRCAHDYNAPAGQSVCVPFVVTNKGYGIVWDNPSATTVAFGFNDQTRWTSDVGQRVSFFVIAGKTYDEIYEGYRLLTGDVPMLPKSAYGYIQCKQRYTSQEELLGVAKGYRERHYPIDDLVVDWFHYTKMGEMDMDPAKWPDPVAMNKQLHAMNFHTMISVWPRFIPEDRYYGTILKNDWFEKLADGTPTNGLPYDRAGADIDTTNPDAAKWYWGVVKDNYVKMGFDSFWADETEPDLPPNGSYFHVGPGTQFFNVYPYFHTKAFYDGIRHDLSERALILARDSYLGAQHNGTIFWSSDISANWDTLKRQVPTGINFVASGMPYWSTDIGGWQFLPEKHVPERPVLLDPSDARANIEHYDDYPELYVRWFEYGAFQPNFRSHGSRPQNEVWSYGKAAEPILVKYLRLRYQMMPYLYSLGHMSHETGAPFMRGLFMDFGDDPKVANLGDEYMFGPSILVAPVTEQGRTSREVYLPAGTDWYNFWTNEKVHGGQSITVAAPIETIPLFVKAGSILPLGAPVENTNDLQQIAKLRVYPGRDADFELYSDDGTTYKYEKGDMQLTKLHWSESVGKLTREGAKLDVDSEAGLVEVVGK
ncbi:TIM-barrel domain-containing protein [Granulicella sibirica]|uniref:Alpha-xylosidase n=1 Tax=Granulicella sibirica TaxID=2479048 RepID=A0A4Q0T831_9BACT|nr:glycoside hydrolase family 31 protein [Granulicella sibirica]RXH57866.1 Alpha-xylosidase [Granulicella sibirica]